MDRNKTPLRFTILWAVNIAIFLALDRFFDLKNYLPISQDKIEVILTTAAGVMAGLGEMLWMRLSDKD